MLHTVLVLAVLLPSQPQTPPAVRTVPSVDLGRYLGTWHEVARLPNWFQRNCAGNVLATYSRRPDGRLDVLNQCRKENGDLIDAKGIARVVDEKSSARLKVRFAPAFLSFLPMVWGDYWILGLAEDYGWAVVGSPDRKYLWILARVSALPDAEFRRAVDIARSNGFDVDKLVRTAHEPAR